MHLSTLITSLVLAVSSGITWAETSITIEKQVTPATVLASSEFGELQTSKNTINGSGLTGGLHDEDPGGKTMWHTTPEAPASTPATGLPAAPAWLHFTFDAPAHIEQIAVWNHNQFEHTNRGFRKIRLYATTDGKQWNELPLGASSELPQGGSQPHVIKLPSDKKVQYKGFILAADSNYGGNCYGLSEVNFLYSEQVSEKAAPFPTAFDCIPQPFYRHRKDGEAGRQIDVNLTGNKLYGAAEAIVAVSGGTTETIPLEAVRSGTDKFRILLPPGVAVEREAQVFITIKRGDKSIAKQVIVPAKRQWKIYIYPHSHVDIGYTNTHENIELIHKYNMVKGIELARKTADWPAGSRFVWNPEVTWPIERYLLTATPEEREVVYDAIRKGWIGVDSGYINDNTTVACDEEMFPYMAYKFNLEKATNVKIDSLMQVDVPGMSWGVVPAAAECGIRYIMQFHNGGDRTGWTNDLNYRPFWWEAPDGKSRVLFFQQGSYNPGAAIKGLPVAVAMMGERDPVKLKEYLDSVKTDQPRTNFADQYFLPTTQLLESGSAAPFSMKLASVGFLGYLSQMENKSTYPYDLFMMSWAMADNTPIDQDLPAAVRSWNEEYAYPKLIISSTHTFMSDFEKKYGDKIPTMRGDFTEYWTDGLGSAAKHTGMNRNSKEKLIQADTLWSMLQPGKPAPRADFSEAWRNVVLGSEHTWAYAKPSEQPMQNDILSVKLGYFDKAAAQSENLKNRSLAVVSDKKSSVIAVLNTLSWDRSELVTLSADQSQAGDGVTDDAGSPVPSQRLKSGELVFLAKAVPAFGAKNFTISAEVKKSSIRPATASGYVLDNGIVKVTLDKESGDIASLIMDGREYVDQAAPCRLNSYRYLHGADSGDKASGPTDVKISIKENGPLVASFLIESQAEGCNKLLREVRITAESPDVACDNLVDKIEKTNKEGIHFGFAFNLPNAHTRVDIPWGVMEIEKDQLPGANRNWICFQRWMDISNNEAGVTWSALDAATFQYGQMSANILGAALFSHQWLRELKPSSTIYSWALNNHWHTNFPLSQSGEIPFRYRIQPHTGGYDAARSNRIGTARSQPLVATPVASKIDITPVVKIDNPRVVVTILRTDESGKLIVRVRSLSYQEETTELTFSDGSKKSITLGPLGMLSVKK